MAGGERAIYAGFGVAVLAALGAVIWLSFAPAKPAGAPPGPGKSKPSGPAASGADPASFATDRPKPTSAEGQHPPRDRRPPATPIVRGTVKDTTGNPVPGARVEVFEGVAFGADPAPRKPVPQPEGMPKPAAERLRDSFYLEREAADLVQPFTGLPRDAAPPRAGASLATAETDAEGKFEITLASPSRVRVEASKESMSRAFLDSIVPNGIPLLLELGTEAPLRGTCIDADTRAPVASAVVVVRSGATLATAKSGADGSFSLPGLPAGKYALQAGAPGYTLTKIRSIDLVPGRPPAEVPLGRGFNATVLVYQGDPNNPRSVRGSPAPAGPPVEGATVVLLDRRDDFYLSAVTGPDGSARFTGLSEGRWDIAVWKDGLSTGLARPFAFDLAKNMADQSRTVAMYPLVATPVRVVDTNGAPVAATLYWCGEDDELNTKYSEILGKTDAGGRISVTFDDGVPRKCMAWVLPENGGAAVQVEPDDPYSGEEVVVVARAGRVIKGRVTDQHERPVKDALVGVEVTDDSLDLDVIVHTYTDADGRYTLPAVPYGETYIEVETEDDWVDEDIPAENRNNPLVKDWVIETWEEKPAEEAAEK